MALSRNLKSLLMGATLMFTAATPAIAQTALSDSDLPNPLRPIASQGVQFVDTFEAPGGLTGYVAEYQGQGLVVYVTADGEYALVGNMLNNQGMDIGAEHIRRIIDEPRYGEAWDALEEANWFIEGDENAPNIIYTFTDPFCPYCRRLHESLKPYVDDGRIQVRHLMVGIIREASPAIASTIIGSDDPYETFLEHMQTYDDGGIVMNGTDMRRGQNLMRENQTIMRDLNLSATPATFYKDRDGVVQLIQGAPRNAATIEQMLVN